MKGLCIAFTCFLSIFLCACGHNWSGNDIVIPNETINSEKMEDDRIENNNEEIIEMCEDNRKKVADALETDEKNRRVECVLNCLATLETGVVQNVTPGEDMGDKVLDIISENGTNYRIYLKNSGNVSAVKNLDTEEWPIKSFR